MTNLETQAEDVASAGGFKRVIRNTLSLFTSDVINRATTFVLYALVGRYMGAYEFGQMSLALTLFYTFQVFAVAGLKLLVTREVARDKSKTNQYFVNASAVVLVTAPVSLAAVAVFNNAMGYADDTSFIIMLLCLSLLPYALTMICEAIFQAWERMQFIAYANMIMNTFKIGASFLVIVNGYDLITVIAIIAFCHIISMLLQWFFIFRYITRPKLKLDPGFGISMVRATSTFLGIDGLIAIISSMNIILLSRITNEAEIGYYSAAYQLLVPMTLVFDSIVLTFFPIMCRRFNLDFTSLKEITHDLIELLLTAALPVVVGIAFMADFALALIYGEGGFEPAALALRIIIFNLLLLTLTSVMGKVLVAGMRERMTLRIVAIDATVGLIVGIILINEFGFIGAAFTAVIVRVVDFLQHYIPVSRLIGGFPIFKIAWKPVVATAVMTLFLISDIAAGESPFLVILVGMVIYLVTWIPLALWTAGGFGAFRARYQHLWTE